jgi:kynurenine formamidase
MVDLSHRLSGTVHPYPGQLAPTFDTVTTVESHGYMVTEVHSRTHVATHVDTPAHFIKDGRTTFEIGLDEWMGPAWVSRVDTSATPAIEPDMLPLPSSPVEVLLVATGHSASWGTDQYYENAPYLTSAAAEAIRDAGVRLLGLELPSPDRVGDTSEVCHHILLGADMLIVENLTNLDQLTCSTPWFFAVPLLLGGGDGGFCRAFAVC